MSRGGKRLACRIGASLVAGVVLTVAVAWGCAAAGGASGSGGFGRSAAVVRGGHMYMWTELALSRAGAKQYFVYRILNASSTTLHDPPGWVHLEESFAGLHTAGYGLPAVCLRRIVIGGSGRPLLGEWRGGVNLEMAGHALTLPTLVHWPGFALDTAFYGGIVFVLWSAPGFVRRRWRGRRGLCVVCGYDLCEAAAGAVCPECGAVPAPGGRANAGPR